MNGKENLNVTEIDKMKVQKSLAKVAQNWFRHFKKLAPA